MDPELAGLRRELKRHVAGRGKRYEPELRAKLLDWIARRRSQGLSIAAVCAELSLPKQTVSRWASSPRRAPTLVPVEVVADAEPAARTLRVVSHAGLVIEGLTVEEVAALLRMLR